MMRSSSMDMDEDNSDHKHLEHLESESRHNMRNVWVSLFLLSIVVA